MGRPARYIPETKDGVLVEVTSRVIGARAMLVPSPNPRRFNEVVVGVMGRALEVSPLELCGAVVLANHALCRALHKHESCYNPIRVRLYFLHPTRFCDTTQKSADNLCFIY